MSPASPSPTAPCCLQLAFALNSVHVHLCHAASGLAMVHSVGKVCLKAVRSEVGGGMSVVEVHARCEKLQVLRDSPCSFLEASVVACTASIDLPPEVSPTKPVVPIWGPLSRRT